MTTTPQVPLQAKGPEFQEQFDTLAQLGPVTLGPSASHYWRSDPRRMPIVLSRYKFVSKMLARKQRVVEIGCGDGFATRIVLQTVAEVHGVDYDAHFIAAANAHARHEGLNASFAVCDILAAPPQGRFDAAYSLDVIEHIPAEHEALYLKNIVSVLPADGVCIIGTPNITADAYASKASKEGHINLQSADRLTALLATRFANVFLFSMNDEVVHTGFSSMAHYLLAMGVGVLDQP